LDLERQNCPETPQGLLVAQEASPHPRLRLHRAFPSRYLPDTRDLIVYLPPGYDQQQARTYSVLYLQDGQNLFDGRTSFLPGRTWGLREHADAAIEAGQTEPMVIVGIYHAGPRRIAEYTFEPDDQLGGGEAEQYGLMLTRELMPWIASQYRVRTERTHTGLGGSSLGALVSLYLGLRHPQLFGKLALLSPSVWWNRKSILRFLSQHAPQLCERPRLWLDVGDREGLHTLEDAQLLHRRLLDHGWRPDENLHFEEIQGGTHDEASWALRVQPLLKFLFPAIRPPSPDLPQTVTFGDT
jgi:enterochelin esterase-like enzyme